jgi:DNA-binding GntR family transcriptional regulator
MSRAAAVSLTPQSSRLADLTIIGAAFMQAFAPGLPRYLQLQNAIIGLIRSGELRGGAQLPPDQQLTGALDVSLGTVQKAFAGLATDGWISREQGRGTFIAKPRQPVTELWHYRFRDPDSGSMLLVYSRLLKRRHVAADERVRRALGEDPKGFIEIERLVDIGGKFTCYSELYLPASRFSRILEIPITGIESVNLKKLFADEFGAPTISVEQSIRACQFEPDVAKLIGKPEHTCGMVLEATAFTYGRAAISFQRIHIPQSDSQLDVSPLPSAPKTFRQ